ncbi:MAG: hypothetical protein GC192_20340 [Bacteroidetes bacterium]|nr:hypothetical protein [Bacteroidota bacterium]
MIPVIYFQHHILMFLIAAPMALLIGSYMKRFNRHLCTHDGSLREFNLMDLEFPSNVKDIPNIIRGIYKLKAEDQCDSVIKALRKHLYIDYLFMPAIYGAIFLLCMYAAHKLAAFPVEQGFFASLAWLQLLAWVLDIYENGQLLGYIRPDIGYEIPAGKHRFFVIIVWAKWVIALAGLTCALMMMLYFWLTGQFGV